MRNRVKAKWKTRSWGTKHSQGTQSLRVNRGPVHPEFMSKARMDQRWYKSQYWEYSRGKGPGQVVVAILEAPS